MQKWADRLLVCVCVAMACLAGCKEGEQLAGETLAVEPPTPMQELNAALRALDEAGDTNGVVARLESSLQDAAFADQRPVLQNWLLGYELRIGRLDAAIARFDAMIDAAPDIALSVLDLFPRHFQNTGDEAGLVAWCERVLANPGADPLVPSLWQLMVPSFVRQGRYAEVVARLPSVLALGETHARPILERVLRQGLNDKAYADMLSLVGAIEAGVEPGTELVMVATLTKADVMLCQARLDEVEQLLMAKALTMRDGDLAVRVVQLVRAAGAAGKGAQVERVVSQVLSGMPDQKQTRDQVGRAWVRLAVDAKDGVTFVARTGKLLEAGVTPSRVAAVYEDGFYVTMVGGDADLRQACATLGKRILQLDGLTDYETESLLMRQLDSAFYRQDFKSALVVLEGGIPNHDEAWHADMIRKVSAHMAQQEGRHEEAIKLFRAHMDGIEAWTEPIRNPENGNMMTKEAVMGFNEKRIGDIYAAMGGRDEDAKAAYRRAREWYGKALEVLNPDSPEHAEARKELAGVPGA